jgi:hypothetical protein
MGVGLNLGVGEEEDLAGSVVNLGTFPSQVARMFCFSLLFYFCLFSHD